MRKLILIFTLVLALTICVCAEARLGYITDDAGVLQDQDRLEQWAETLSDTYDCGLYVVLVEDYSDYGTSPENAARNLYQDYDLGVGSDRDGMILLISLTGDYTLSNFGYWSNDAFTEYAKDQLEDAFWPGLHDRDFDEAISRYLSVSNQILQTAASGQPMEEPATPWADRILKAYGIAFLVGLVVALVTTGIWKSQLKSTGIATGAAHYVEEDGVDIDIRQDQYTHTTRTQRRIPRNNGSGRSGGGGGRSYSSRSGKF